jgi:hypothetical protein
LVVCSGSEIRFLLGRVLDVRQIDVIPLSDGVINTTGIQETIRTLGAINNVGVRLKRDDTRHSI